MTLLETLSAILSGLSLTVIYNYWKRDKQRRELRQQFEEHLARELARELNAWRERRTQELRAHQDRIPSPEKPN